MTRYEEVKKELRDTPRRWAITGVAGFIGSNLLEHLLKLDQTVIGLDNFSTGNPENLNDVRSLVTDQQWKRFTFIEGDIRNPGACRRVCEGTEYVLHHAALGSVPRSIEDPLASNENNVTGTLNMLLAACECNVRRFVYAASSAVYGDHPALPKREELIGRPLSPYAVTKYVNELYAGVFGRLYDLETIGLRYFNVFGQRQNPDGAYAAVIPKWIQAMIKGEKVRINGTGETSRDFCFIENVVQINLLAALTTNREAVNQVYNTALNDRTSLNELYAKLKCRLVSRCDHLQESCPDYVDFRKGDVLHSQADITKASTLLGYAPSHTIDQGLDASLEWYLSTTA